MIIIITILLLLLLLITTATNHRVKEVRNDGLAVTFFSMFSGTIDAFHLDEVRLICRLMSWSHRETVLSLLVVCLSVCLQVGR